MGLFDTVVSVVCIFSLKLFYNWLSMQQAAIDLVWMQI